MFRSRRQRGAAPPPSKEYHLHCALADVLKRWCSPDWRYTHIPLGEYRPPATAARLARMGVTPGWPDFQFVGPGKVAFLELKRRGARATAHQERLALHLQQAGCDYVCTDSFQVALDALREWGVVPSTIRDWSAA